MSKKPAAKAPCEVTRLLRAWQQRDGDALDELWSILYEEIKDLARSVLRGQGRGAGDQATSLVHKAYLRLLDSKVECSDRRHFFAVAARAMRFVLVDEARRQLTERRGKGEILSLGPELPEVADPAARHPDEVLAIHEALNKLAELRPRQVKLVELRYFAGLSTEETAGVLDVTSRTVVRDWKTVRIWLHTELGGTT